MADALSRHREDQSTALVAISILQLLDLADIKRGQHGDEKCAELFARLQAGELLR